MQANTLSQVSCLTCRKQHKKCDRKLPKCNRLDNTNNVGSLCARRGRVCDYKPPDKRGPKGNETHRPYPEIHAQILRPPIQPARTNNFLQEFRNIIPDIVSWDLPIISEDSMLQALEYVEKLETNIALTANISRPDEDMIVLIYSLLCYYVRSWGNVTVAAQYFEKARQSAAVNFERILKSPVMAVAYTVLAYYSMSEGDTDKAYFYLSSVGNYVDFNNTDLLDQAWTDPNQKVDDFAAVKFVRQFYYMVGSTLNPNMDMSAYVKGFCTKMYNLQQYHLAKVQESPTKNSKLSLAMSKCELVSSEEIRMMRYDLHARKDSFLIPVERFQEIISKMYQLIENLKGLLPEVELQARRAMGMLFHQGYRIKMAQIQQNELEAREAADMIANLTGTMYFGLLTPSILNVVSLAAMVHAQVLAKTKDDYAKSMVLDRLKDDYKAFMVMSERHKFVRGKHEKVISYIEKIIRKVDESFLLTRLKTSIPEQQAPFQYNFANTLYNFTAVMEQTQHNHLVPANMENQEFMSELTLQLLLDDALDEKETTVRFEEVDDIFDNLI
jgi:hypothetical protein